MFRIQAKANFLAKETKSRLFLAPGGGIVDSPDIVKLILPGPPERIKFQRPAVVSLTSGDPSQMESYYPQPLLKYQEVVEKSRASTGTIAGEFDF